MNRQNPFVIRLFYLPLPESHVPTIWANLCGAYKMLAWKHSMNLKSNVTNQEINEKIRALAAVVKSDTTLDKATEILINIHDCTRQVSEGLLNLLEKGSASQIKKVMDFILSQSAVTMLDNDFKTKAESIIGKLPHPTEEFECFSRNLGIKHITPEAAWIKENYFKNTNPIGDSGVLTLSYKVEKLVASIDEIFKLNKNSLD